MAYSKPNTGWEVLVFIKKKGWQKFCDYSAIETEGSKGSAQTPTVPLENGQFAMFNKVQDPTEVTVSLLFDGDYELQNMELAKIKSAKNGTTLFKIVTPSEVYSNMSLNSYNISRRHDSGGHLLAVDCTFLEIKSSAIGKNAYSNTNPTSGNDVKKGNETTKTPSKKMISTLGRGGKAME